MRGGLPEFENGNAGRSAGADGRSGPDSDSLPARAKEARCF